MIELIKELLKREWWFEMCTGYDGANSDGELDYHLHIYLGNQEFRIYNDEQAKELLDEIHMYW
jgi:hypothetical protein